MTEIWPRREKVLRLPRFPSAIYVVGDVHGCSALFKELEERIYEDGACLTGVKLVVLAGDIIDRGPDTAGLLDHLLKCPPAGVQRLALRGNHEAMFLDVIRGRMDPEEWLNSGGLETISSYGHGETHPHSRKALCAVVPREHIDYLRKTALALSVGGYVISHAGYEHQLTLGQQRQRVLLGHQRPVLPPVANSKVSVHGHHIVERATITGSEILLDTGAYLTGRLSAVRLTEHSDPAIISVG